MIIDYVVCKGSDESELSELVKDYMLLGWQPFGGLVNSILYLPDGDIKILFAQAMVKYI